MIPSLNAFRYMSQIGCVRWGLRTPVAPSLRLRVAPFHSQCLVKRNTLHMAKRNWERRTPFALRKFSTEAPKPEKPIQNFWGKIRDIFFGQQGNIVSNGGTIYDFRDQRRKGISPSAIFVTLLLIGGGAGIITCQIQTDAKICKTVNRQLKEIFSFEKKK